MKINLTRLLGFATDMMDAENDYHMIGAELRKGYGIKRGESMYVDSLPVEQQRMMYSASERADRAGYALADVCAMLNIEQDAVIKLARVINRQEAKTGRAVLTGRPFRVGGLFNHSTDIQIARYLGLA